VLSHERWLQTYASTLLVLYIETNLLQLHIPQYQQTETYNSTDHYFILLGRWEELHLARRRPHVPCGRSIVHASNGPVPQQERDLPCRLQSDADLLEQQCESHRRSGHLRACDEIVYVQSNFEHFVIKFVWFQCLAVMARNKMALRVLVRDMESLRVESNRRPLLEKPFCHEKYSLRLKIVCLFQLFNNILKAKCVARQVFDYLLRVTRSRNAHLRSAEHSQTLQVYVHDHRKRRQAVLHHPIPSCCVKAEECGGQCAGTVGRAHWGKC